jgi:hypothetical protein
MEKRSVNKICFVPEVKELVRLDGFMKVAESAPVDFIVEEAAFGSDERYTLTVLPDGVRIVSSSKQGFYRAGTTLKQLLASFPQEVPCLEIVDWPDFPVRGFYHDVTRGKVPKLETLKHLADTLAYYKINHLQLYVEHAFAFRNIPELWEGKDPLTIGGILELDEYCADRYIDLVPSLSTFGHLYELLRLPRFEHLNELDIKASQVRRCLWDRMAHYTLDVGNPESFELVEGMIKEYAQLFRSGYFNICCDETFDLGKGKNAARAASEGVGRLYVDFVKRVMDAVRSVGKKPMLWGDIVVKHPELISELAGDDVIFLNWDYTPDVSDETVRTFKAAGVTQYVCPGVNGWSRFATDVNRACSNISRMVRYGKAAGAPGVVNTDWGDCGHVNLLANSFHGLAFGAELSWNAAAADAGGGEDDFDRRFSFLQWGIDDGRLGEIMRELGELSADYHFGNVYAWVNEKECLWYKEDDVKAADPAELARRYRRAVELEGELEGFAAPPEEYVWSASATAWLLSLLIVKKRYEYRQEVDDADIPVTPAQLIDNGRSVLAQFKVTWRARNRESELRDVVDTFEKVFCALSAL